MNVASLRPDLDPNGLLEFSVVFSDRSLNSMSNKFCAVMRDISQTMREVYQADAVAVVPGGGTYGMEAIARQLAHGVDTLVIRNGWFSYRWTQILDVGEIARSSTVVCSRQVADEAEAPFAPPSLEELLTTIRKKRPSVVFCPHVETSAGLMMPDDHLHAIAQCVHEHNGLFVLDCVASGMAFVDMSDLGIDVLLTAPQKGWSASPCAALVMLSARARARVEATQSSSFAHDLKRWLKIMETYEGGGHAYHTTMPTDGLLQLSHVLSEARTLGFSHLQKAQFELGRKARILLERYGYRSVAASGFQAPSVIVSYCPDPQVRSGQAFIDQGLQIAAGVPLQCGERSDFSTFRIGLFGLDKLTHIERTLDHLERALKGIKSS